MSSPPRRRLDRFLVALDRLILRIFFRQVEVVGAENVPASGPLLVVANHGNSLVDPMLVFGFLPRPCRFLAKSTLWRHPAAKYLVRLAAAIPVYRRQDSGFDSARNVETFARSYEELATGGAIAIFPEGLSHSEPALAPLKTGVARIALGAEERFGPLGTVIVPVGLNFDEPQAFRSRVLVRVGAGLSLSPPARGERGTPAATAAAARRGEEEREEGEDAAEAAEKEAVRELTARVEEALRGVTLNYDSWRQAELLDCAAEVYSRRAVEAPRRARLSEQFELKKAFLAGFRRLRRHDPERVAAVLAVTERYDLLLREVGLEDRHVAASYPRGLVVRFVLRHLWSLTLWRPLSLIGLILNWLPYKIPGWVTRAARLPSDVRATWKVLISVVVFPLFWLLEAGLALWRFGWVAGLATLALAPAVGYLALTYSEDWAALRDESRAFLKLKGKRSTVAELTRRRARVAAEIDGLIEAHRRM